jgi:Protein of unknown function (DUF3467)
MAKNTGSRKKPAGQLPAPINPRGIESVYSNNMEVHVSNMDARITFNEIIADHGVLTVERRAHVVMPLDHYRAMVQALNSVLPNLEKAIAAAKK